MQRSITAKCIYDIINHKGLMRKLVEYDLEDGSSIWIEVDDLKQPGLKNVDSKKMHRKLQKIFSMIKPSTELILDNFRGIKPLPKEVELEFGLKLNTQVGAVIASTSGEANYKIILKWDRGDINEQLGSK